MSNSGNGNEEVSSSADVSGESEKLENGEHPKPPAKRPAPQVIEISDTESDDSDICAVTSYQASADEVKRIRGDLEQDQSYSSSSSSSDYSSDSESPWEDDSVVIADDLARVKIARTQLNTRADRMEDPQLNSNIKSETVINDLSTCWKEKKDYETKDITFICSPFRLCLIKDFLTNKDIINNIVDDMNTLDWNRKKMDLYEYHQTADLANLTWQRSIRGIYELLKTDIMNWVSSVSGLELTSVSASCSMYGPGDHLLVHDDLMGTRRVAFILYLAPWPARPRPPRWRRRAGGKPQKDNGDEDQDITDVEEIEAGWTGRLGGALECLNGSKGEGGPSRIVLPTNNMMALFPVGSETFHQVEEVLSLELPRLSINGWFHGPGENQDHTVEYKPLERHHPTNMPIPLELWVSPTYMSPRARSQIQTQVESSSEVSLQEFILPEQYQAVLEALAHPDVEWEWWGPYTVRKCRRIKKSWLQANSSPLKSNSTSEPSSSDLPNSDPIKSDPINVDSDISDPIKSDLANSDPTKSDPANKDSANSDLNKSDPANSDPTNSDPANNDPTTSDPIKSDPGNSDSPSKVLSSLLGLFSGNAFRRLLGDCTDLTLLTHENLEILKITPGDYTLLPPREYYKDPRLEVVMYLGVPPCVFSGGSTLYVSVEDSDGGTLVTIPPKSNTLNLVYCDQGAAGFTKYLSKITLPPGEGFYLITCTYRE